VLYGDKRQDTREVFFNAWRKFREHLPLEGIETVIVDVLTRHPEYHGVVENPDRFLDRDYSPELGETNPFLHLGMHIAIEEQLSIDQPPGVRGHFERLRERLGDSHEAQHIMMDCLGEMLWQSQRQGTPPDAAVYFECLSRR
jgi:hypothetical protein